MTRLLSSSFPPSLQSQFIGLDELLKVLDAEPSKFPLTNILMIEKNESQQYRLEIALAGYKKDDLEVIKNGRKLYVQTKDNYKNPELPSDTKYLVKEISTKSFFRSFQLHSEYMDVINVQFQDGILTIDLEMNLPEKLKPKTFLIK